MMLASEPTVYAQDSERAYRGDEVFVTARKIEEIVQDVPLAISAYSADDISSRSIQELEKVALLTPGLTFEDYSNGGFGTPIIRGASQSSIDALELNVSTFVDGIYIPRQNALDLGTVDMERIEVVKGPQSALYGANSFMGAINTSLVRRAWKKLTEMLRLLWVITVGEVVPIIWTV